MFKVGKRYKVRMVDQVYPVLEPDPNDEFGFVCTDREEFVAGKVYDITVLSYPNDTPGFVYVENHAESIKHLLHVESVESVTAL